MNIRVLLLSLTAAALVAPLSRAQDASAPEHEHAQHNGKAGKGGEHEHTELGDHMEKMGRALRQLGRQINDASKNEDSLKLIETVRTNAEAAAKLEPAKTKDVPADQRDKFIADYREQMNHFIADVQKVEAALQQGNNEQAAALMKASFKKDMDAGHKEFRKKRDEM